MKTWLDRNGKTCYDINSMSAANRFRLMFGHTPLKEMQAPKLFAVTQMVEQMTPEEAICWMARISSPQNQDKHDTAFKLIRYLVENSHWSPLDMVNLTVEIECTRAVMAQLERHWSFRFQEFSQRYAIVGNGVEPMDWSHIEAREKHSGGNRQGSGEPSNVGTYHLKQQCKAAEAGYYEAVIKNGISPETARMGLPLGTLTKAYVTGSVRSFVTYFWQRASLHDAHAQKEHRILADGIFDVFKVPFPNIAVLVEEGMPRYVTKDEWKVIKQIREAAKDAQ